MKPKMTTVRGFTIGVIFGLGACATNETSLSSMSCTDLAREIGKATQTRDDAAVDSVVGTIDMLAADNTADEITGGVDSLVGDISGAAAESRLDTLNRAFAQKGCV